MNVSDALRLDLRLPLIAAPMLLVSGPELVAATCRAGVVGALPASNARTADELGEWLRALSDASAEGGSAPYALNIIVKRAGDERYEQNVALAEAFRVPIVISSVGKPGGLVQRIHAYGGIVLHDVATLRHARKAIDEGVDGLILLTTGAGGHTGFANPFAFMQEVRAFWDGPIALAGGIASGRAIHAAQVAGADLAYSGTPFIATTEARADPAYKQMVADGQMADVFVTDRLSGMPASFLRPSLIGHGLDPDRIPPLDADGRPDLPDGLRPWRDLWSAGQGLGAVSDIVPAAQRIAQLEQQYRASRDRWKS